MRYQAIRKVPSKPPKAYKQELKVSSDLGLYLAVGAYVRQTPIQCDFNECSGISKCFFKTPKGLDRSNDYADHILRTESYHTFCSRALKAH